MYLYNGEQVCEMSDKFNTLDEVEGKLVDSAVVMHFINALPPHLTWSNLVQIGEPYDYKLNPKTGRYAETWSTFTRISGDYRNGVWRYVGECFSKENKKAA